MLDSVSALLPAGRRMLGPVKLGNREYALLTIARLDRPPSAVRKRVVPRAATCVTASR